MRSTAIFAQHLFRSAVSGLCLAAVLCPRSLPACAGSSGFVCVLNPGACTRSMALVKAVPQVVVLSANGSATFSLPMSLFVTCPGTNNCGVGCTNAGVGLPLAPASLTANLYPAGACPSPGPLPPAPITATISTIAGTMTAPTCSSAGTVTAYNVPIVVPPGTPAGTYCVVGMAQVTFPGGLVLSQRGDTTICLVDPMPGQPGLPRLSLELLSPPVPRMTSGDQATARYLVKNNDPNHSVMLTAFATSRQSAVRPQGGNEAQGVFAISNPFGDDFPIQFNPGAACIPLPAHPYTQPEIMLPLPILPPGGSNIVTVGIRSYGQCANGSCGESTLRVQGVFSDNSVGLACAGMALLVDTAMPSQNCGTAVNDCNHNGIPDALDIEARRSQDRNYNAMPDECEQFISVPSVSSVTPTNPFSGAPIQVQVAFNEAVPMQNVWANGSPLIRTQLFSQPFWVGTIPADTRPGPQTVYFLGKDLSGGLSTYGATYQVRPQPITILVQPGYATLADNLFATQSNYLSTVLPNAADGTTISKWNPAFQAYTIHQFIAGLGWDIETTLLPGEGAWLFSPAPQTFQFQGTTAPALPRLRPLPGLILVGCRTPQPADFEQLMGFPPIAGDKVYKYDNTTPNLPSGPSSTHTFSNGVWNPSVPILAPGKGAFVELVAPAPRLTAPTRLGNGAFRFAFSNVLGVNYTVLAATDVSLRSSNWTILGPASNAGGGLYQFTDPGATNYPRRFYQLRWP